MGVEPTSSAWKADVLAVVRQPHHTYDIIPACVGICQVVLQLDQLILEFYNPDKGRKTLNLTEKYKKSAGSKENKKVSPAEREKRNVVSGYWRRAQNW